MWCLRIRWVVIWLWSFSVMRLVLGIIRSRIIDGNVVIIVRWSGFCRRLRYLVFSFYVGRG